MRRSGVAGSVAAIVAAAWVNAPVEATAAGTACHGEISSRFQPGISLEPGRASFAVDPVPAVNCDGPVLGREVTGPGVYTSDGRIGTTDPDTCLDGGEGWGVVTIVFPTTSGPLTVRSPVTFTYGGLKRGLLTGEVEGDYMDGTFVIRPKKGDCVTAPVTEGFLTFRVTFHKFRSAG